MDRGGGGGEGRSVDRDIGKSGNRKVNPGVESAKSLFFGVDQGEGALDRLIGTSGDPGESERQNLTADKR
jgi:hypothetical protein